MKRFYPVLILIVASMFVLMGCSQSAPATNVPAATSANVEATSTSTQTSTDAASPTTATLDGKTLLETRCIACHSLARVASAKGDAAQWQKVIDQMVQKGAQLNADEEKVLVEYLAANFK